MRRGTRATDGALPMSHAPRTPAYWPLFALLACCSPPATTLEDAAADRGSEDSAQDVMAADDSAAQDAFEEAMTDASSDASTPSDAACAAPEAGALQANYYCDTASVHVLALTGSATRVMAFARLGTGGSTECGVVDSVEITRGSTMLQRVSASQAFTVGATSSLVLSATAEPALEAACADRTGRLSAYGMIIRGRDQRGPFEARCGAAESGGRWPPGLHLACHQNLEQPPTAFPPAMFTVSAVGPSMATSAYASVPHGPAAPALTMIDATIEVLSPQRSPLSGGAPLMGAVTHGWMNRVSESTQGSLQYTQLSLNAFGMAPFSSELCPALAMPGPGFTPPPYFLAKLTGQSARGATSLEVLASCSTMR